MTSQHPLALYVAVNQGSAPVLRAEVTVWVKVLTENATELSIPPFRLTDNGNGDPDMVRGDGIYSRYVTEYPAAGRYTFTVAVSDQGGRAVFVTKMVNVTERCCGSYLDLAEAELRSTGAFSRLFTAPALNLLQVPASTDPDRMPPARIGDLRIQVKPELTSLLATWTAPGGNFDAGTTAGYRFLYSASLAALLDPTQEPPELVSLERRDTAGSSTSHQFLFPHLEQEFYVGLVAYDEMNNTGKMSNIVSVLMPALVVESAPTIEDRSVEVSLGAGATDWTMIGALCGAILLLAVFLLGGILYFLKFAAPKKPVTVSVSGKEDGTDASSCSSDGKNTSSHRLMPDITTIAGNMPMFQAPPSSLPDSTPTYWSATQLLTEHEQRALNLSYSAIHSPMETIREEYIGYPEEYSEYSTQEYTEYSAQEPGISNPAFARNNNGTPVHGVFGAKTQNDSFRSGIYRVEGEGVYRVEGEDRLSASSSAHSESVISLGSALFSRSMGGTGPPDEGELARYSTVVEGEPARYSTAVQTTAPSTTASLRFNRTRNVSLV